MSRLGLILTFSIVLLLGCTKDKKDDELIQSSSFSYKIETVSFSASNSSISSDFSNEYYISSDTIFIYNRFSQSVEYFDFPSFEIKSKYQLKAGYEEIISPSAFIVDKDEVILIHSSKIQRYKNADLLKEYNLIKGDILNHIFDDVMFVNFGNIVVGEFAKNARYFDAESQILYMVVQHGFDYKEFVIVSFDFKNDRISKLLTIDLESINKYHKIRFNNNRSIVGNGIFSSLLFIKNYLVFSLSHHFDFKVIELDSLHVIDKAFDNLNFKKEKDRSEKNEYSDLKSANNAITEWGRDIAFGPIEKLNNQYFIRLVKDDKRTNNLSNELFLIVFDQDFKIIDQVKLSKKIKNLSLEYFTFNNQLFIKQNSESENKFVYSVVKLIDE